MPEPGNTIALVNILNATGAAKMRVPVGLIYLGSALKKNGFDVKIYQAVQNEDEIRAIEQQIVDSKPLLVGFSVFMGPGSVTSLEMSERIKAKLDTTILWGGKFPSSISSQVIVEPAIDIVCIGEGEETIVDLARTLKEGGDLHDVKGICFLENGEVVYPGQRDIIHDLDALEFDFSLIENWDRYVTRHNGKPALLDVIESQRGCPFRCRFCYNSRDLGRDLYNNPTKFTVRAHSVDWVIEKIKQLKELTDVQYISFCDDEFWIKQDRSFEIIDRLYDMGIRFYKLRMRFSSLKGREMVEKLKKYGIFSLNFGLESGVDRILQLMNKRLTTDEVEKKIALLAEYPKIFCGAPVIIGCPTETKEEVKECIRFGMKLCLMNPNFSFGINIYKPLPGTDFFKMSVDMGFEPPTDIRGWMDVEHKRIHKIAHKWIPWFDKKEELNYLRLQQYLPIFVEGVARKKDAAAGGLASRLGPKNILWSILNILVRTRINNWFFLFPFELGFIRKTREIRGLDTGAVFDD